MTLKIWALFSSDIETGQSCDKFVAWWLFKPSVEQIVEAVSYENHFPNERFVESLLEGKPAYWRFTEYQLEEIEEGRLQ